MSHPHRPEDAPDAYTHVATAPIVHGGVRVFNPGDLVPADAVQSLGLATSGPDAVVAKRGTKAAEQAAPASPPAAPAGAPVAGEKPAK